MEFLMEYVVLPLLRFVLETKDVLSNAWDSIAFMFLSVGLDPVWSLVAIVIIFIILIEVIL